MLAEKTRVLIASVAAVIITVGIARFAYTPMIPEMMTAGVLSQSLAGLLATANYAGYLSGAFLIAMIHSSALRIRLYQLGLLGAVATTALMGCTSNEWLWYLLRYLAGLSSATGILIGAGLLMSWLLKRGHKPELGIFFSGLGLGIVLTAILAQLIKTRLGWEQQWLAYGAAALVMLLPVWRWSPDYRRTLPAQAAVRSSDEPAGNAFMLLLQLAYFCAGVGYVVTATFLVAIAEASPLLTGRGWMIWLVAGVAAAPACWFWDRLVRRQGDWPALLLAYLLNGLSVLLLMLLSGLPGILLSAIIYGASFIGIVSMTLSMVGRLYPDNPSRPMSRLTFSYGIAQMLAPAVVGYLAESEGDYTSGLILTLIVMGAGTLLLQLARRASVTSVPAPREAAAFDSDAAEASRPTLRQPG